MHHIIIGGGPAATNAAETIRQFDNGVGQITLISDEPAHSRMALPYWVADHIPREKTYTGDVDYFRRLDVDAKIGHRVAAIDAVGKAVTLENGQSLHYDNLLVATGSTPVTPPITGVDLPGVQPMWTFAHAESVLNAAHGIARPRVVLIGAGFIGFIVLNAMFKRGWELTVVERESQVLPRMLDQDAAKTATKWLDQQGVDVHTGTSVQGITESDGEKTVLLDNGSKLIADIVVIATGVRPNVDLVSDLGLDVDHGVIVNHRMQTSDPNIYAAGDIAQGPVLLSDQTAVHAIQPTAVDHGRVAGANMAGQSIEYPGSLLMNVVDVCGLQTASYGDWEDPQAEAMTMNNLPASIYRKLLWRDDQLVGAIFAGKHNDLGMLTDLGMVKGILQTQTRLGKWKDYLRENPFDIRRAYIGVGIAQKLAATTLLGHPSQARGFRFDNATPDVPLKASHAAYVGTKPR